MSPSKSSATSVNSSGVVPTLARIRACPPSKAATAAKSAPVILRAVATAQSSLACGVDAPWMCVAASATQASMVAGSPMSARATGCPFFSDIAARLAVEQFGGGLRLGPQRVQGPGQQPGHLHLADADPVGDFRLGE